MPFYGQLCPFNAYLVLFGLLLPKTEEEKNLKMSTVNNLIKYFKKSKYG
jgi:hypothetical protein